MKKALDVGCGPKGSSGRFKNHAWVGLDKTDYSHLYGAGEFVQGDLKDPLPFPNNHFDVIWCHHVLEHLPPMHPYVYTKPDEYKGPQDFLIYVFNEMWRVLKHGGHAYLIVPWKEHLNAWRSPTHYRFFVPSFFTCASARSTPGNQSEWGHYAKWRCMKSDVLDDTHVFADYLALQYESLEDAQARIGQLKLPEWVEFAGEPIRGITWL